VVSICRVGRTWPHPAQAEVLEAVRTGSPERGSARRQIPDIGTIEMMSRVRKRYV
jgi:hypothetical protein